MSGGRDAFGRETNDGGPTGRPEPVAARPPSASRPPSAAGLGPRPPLFGRLPLLLLLLVGGAAAVVVTVRAAVSRAEDRPATVAFALTRHPMGDRSLLRATPLRAAVRRATDAMGADERVVGLTVSPERATLTAVDPRDQQRWITVTAWGAVHRRRLPTTSDDRGITLARLDLRVPERVMAARLRALAPYARDPGFSLATDDGRPIGWSLNFSGVRQADSSFPVDLRGRRR